jgi:hypothetical protein
MGFETEPSFPAQENPLFPISTLMNARLFDLRESAENHLKYINTTSDQQIFLDTLECIPPDAPLDLIHDTLTPFVEASLDDETRETLAMFSADLDFIHVFQERGIGGLNEVLNRYLQNAKEGRDDDIKTANQLLYRAIYLFPHVAHGVSIAIDPGVYKHYSEFKGLAEHYQFKHLPPPSEIVLPLPYSFSTGTHGSGERTAIHESVETVKLKRGSQTLIGKPALQLEIESPGFNRWYMNIPLDVVHAIELTSTGHFIPHVDLGPHTSTSERGNYLRHYLLFRNFARDATIPNDMLDHISENERVAIQSLFIPIQQPALWLDRSRIVAGKYLQKGFMALSRHNVEDSLLLEFTNIHYPNLSDNQFTAASRLIIKAIRGEIQLDHLAFITGNQIIERLMTIPPERIDFRSTT